MNVKPLLPQIVGHLARPSTRIVRLHPPDQQYVLAGLEPRRRMDRLQVPPDLAKPTANYKSANYKKNHRKPYLKVGGGFPWAGHVKWTSDSPSAVTIVCIVGANLGALLLVGSANERSK